MSRTARDRAGEKYPRKLPDGREICWIAKRLRSKHRKFSDATWVIEYEGCGSEKTILLRDLSRSRLPTCSICGIRLRTVKEVEKAHPGYAGPTKRGYDRHVIESWIIRGWLVEGPPPAPKSGATKPTSPPPVVVPPAEAMDAQSPVVVPPAEAMDAQSPAEPPFVTQEPASPDFFKE